MYNVVINFSNGKKIVTTVAGEKNLLEELEQQSIYIARGCLSGACGVCRMEIIKGQENFLPSGFIEQDTMQAEKKELRQWRLACCATVTGDIEIKCDEEL